jgi:hypothetical protein
VLLATVTATLVCRRVHRASPPKHLAESEADTPSEPELALPGPIYDPGTVRRQTGLPQTFYEWVRTSNNEAVLAKQEPFPPLQQDYDPPISSAASSVYSRPTVSRAGTMARPVTRNSTGASSLRRAVLGTSEPMEENEGKTEAAKKNEIMIKDTKEEKTLDEVKTRVYSGAWPCRTRQG